ncbi:glyoxalase [Flavobacterium sp.]|jgi:hypothetical protein|uniref:glyoxalase n=1 Tax=Flavobacterium sp. TaxID=239 RepID=UPI0037BEB7CA
MNTKDNYILALRGDTLGNVSDDSRPEERFQNQTLRPILKVQNELFLAVFKNYLVKQKIEFHTITPEKKMLVIDKAIQRDMKFRNILKGMIIGFFTLEEFETYTQNSSNLNKRMMNLLIERLKSQLQLLD